MRRRDGFHRTIEIIESFVGDKRCDIRRHVPLHTPHSLGAGCLRLEACGGGDQSPASSLKSLIIHIHIRKGFFYIWERAFFRELDGIINLRRNAIIDGFEFRLSDKFTS